MSTSCFVQRFIQDLESATQSLTVKEKRATAKPPRWIPPPSGLMKINVDAAVLKNSGKASYAAVARDATGLFLEASSFVVAGMTDPETLEAMAVREGLALAIASDNSGVVRSISGLGSRHYDQIIKEIKARAASFLVTDFVHEGRLSNGDAHTLARGSLFEVEGRHLWLLSPPCPPDGVCNSYNVE
ncbi:hypothetical protein EJB05_57772, partial [Eragrostis curvula]